MREYIDAEVGLEEFLADFELDAELDVGVGQCFAQVCYCILYQPELRLALHLLDVQLLVFQNNLQPYFILTQNLQDLALFGSLLHPIPESQSPSDLEWPLLGLAHLHALLRPKQQYMRI